jgi:signal transduction histidine kinase
VVFLTAHSDDDTVGAAMKTAPYGYLLKPVNAHELQIAIKVALSKSALEREDARKRTELERIFLHDIMNIAGGIHGISSLLGSRSSGQLKPLADIIEMASGSLVDEIKAQRLLIQAEKGELVTHFDQICALEAIRDAVAIYKGHEVAKGKNVVADGAALEFTTDKTILLRVLGNMLKNALEATEPRGRGVDSLRARRRRRRRKSSSRCGTKA